MYSGKTTLFLDYFNTEFQEKIMKRSQLNRNNNADTIGKETGK